MKIASLVLGILTVLWMFIASIPFLGWLNWANIPFAVIGLVLGIIALGRSREGRGPAITGIVLWLLLPAR